MVTLFGAKKKRFRRKISVCFVRANLNLNSDFVASYKIDIFFDRRKFVEFKRNLEN